MGETGRQSFCKLSLSILTSSNLLYARTGRNLRTVGLGYRDTRKPFRTPFGFSVKRPRKLQLPKILLILRREGVIFKNSKNKNTNQRLTIDPLGPLPPIT
jgi:hypothetical protein